MEQKLEKIDVLPQKLRGIHQYVHDLSSCVEQTCGLAQGVSGYEMVKGDCGVKPGCISICMWVFVCVGIFECVHGSNENRRGMCRSLKS